MTAFEIMLLLTGLTFMVGSFFVTERLTPSQLNKVAELSEDEIKKIIERSIFNAEGTIEDTIERRIDESTEKIDRALEKETNEKIMAINEYSDTVMENMNKTQNEIMFLYSMLNDKHTEMTGMVSDIQKLAADIRNLNETITKKAQALKAATAKAEKARASQPAAAPAENKQNTPVKEELNISIDVSAAAKDNAPVEAKGNTAASRTAAAALEAARKAPQSAAPKSKRTVVYMGEQDPDNHNAQILDLADQGMGEVEIAKKLKLGVGEVRVVLGVYRGAMA